MVLASAFKACYATEIRKMRSLTFGYIRINTGTQFEVTQAPEIIKANAQLTRTAASE